MKEASGELNMTVVTIVAISLIAVFFGTILWPKINNSISKSWESAGNKAEETWNRDVGSK